MTKSTSLYNFFKEVNHGQTYPKGTTIVQQGGSLEFVYLIESGMVKISDADAFGNSRSVAIFSDQHIFPISWLLKSEPEGARYNYLAVSDTRCLLVERTKLRSFLKQNPDICFSLLDILTRSYVNATARIHALQRANVRERVDFVIYYLAKLFGSSNNGKIVEINTPLTHQEIADLAGVSREAVSHQLAKPMYQRTFWKENHKTCIDLSRINVDSMPHVYSLRVN